MLKEKKKRNPYDNDSVIDPNENLNLDIDRNKIGNSKDNNLKNVNLRTVFLKPKYGDASGVRGAALLGRKQIY